MQKSHLLFLIGSFALVGIISACGGISGPPDEVSRDYAKQLLSDQPAEPGAGITINRDVVRCLKAEGYVIDRIRWRLTDSGQQHFDKINFGFFTETGIIFPTSPITLTDINVTGVRSPRPDASIIEYTAKHSYGGLEKKTGCLSPIDVEPQAAVAEKYDDGWRIKGLSAVLKGRF